MTEKFVGVYIHYPLLIYGV